MSADEGHRVDDEYYLRRFTSPIESAVQAIGATNQELDRIIQACEHARSGKGSKKRQMALDAFVTGNTKALKR